MKYTIPVLIVLVLAAAGAGWYIWEQSSPQEEMPQTENTEETTAPEDAGEIELLDQEVRTFDITGVNYEFSETEIRVSEGDIVTINFESTEGFHDWRIDEFAVGTEQVRPGTKTSTTFVADKKGTFEFYCSVGNHREQGMVGTLIVE